MITVNLSIEQLLEAIHNLNDVEKQQIKSAIFEDDIALNSEKFYQDFEASVKAIKGDINGTSPLPNGRELLNGD